MNKRPEAKRNKSKGRIGYRSPAAELIEAPLLCSRQKRRRSTGFIRFCRTFATLLRTFHRNFHFLPVNFSAKSFGGKTACGFSCEISAAQNFPISRRGKVEVQMSGTRAECDGDDGERKGEAIMPQSL